MTTPKNHQPSGKIWIEHKGKPILGKGGAEILKEIEAEKSLSKAAVRLGMSYRYVWNYVQKIHRALGETVVETYKGGKTGGGGARLTPVGRALLDEYERLQDCLGEFLACTNNTELTTMNSSVRNKLKAKIISIEKGATTAKVKLEVKVPLTVTAVIAKEAVEKLELTVKDEVTATVKSTEILIEK